jgi:hypothetical protein
MVTLWPTRPPQCQIQYQIGVSEGSGGDRNSKDVSKLLFLIILPAFESLPFHPRFPPFFSGLGFRPGRLLPNQLPNRLPARKSSLATSVRRARGRTFGREAAGPVVDAGASGPVRSSAVLCLAPPPSGQFIASRIAVMSASTAPSV